MADSEERAAKVEAAPESIPRKIFSALRQSRVEDDSQGTAVSLMSLYIIAVSIFLFNILPLPFSIQVAVICKYSHCAFVQMK